MKMKGVSGPDGKVSLFLGNRKSDGMGNKLPGPPWNTGPGNVLGGC